MRVGSAFMQVMVICMYDVDLGSCIFQSIVDTLLLSSCYGVCRNNIEKYHIDPKPFCYHFCNRKMIYFSGRIMPVFLCVLASVLPSFRSVLLIYINYLPKNVLQSLVNTSADGITIYRCTSKIWMTRT